MEVRTDGTTTCADVDAWLEPALKALHSAKPGLRLVFLPWGELKGTSLLPFHLHVRWPARVSWLPLNATLAYLPFLNEQLSELRLYPALEAEKWRKSARADRHHAGELTNDLACPDWERTIARNREEFLGIVLSGPCYLAVDAALNGGGFKRGSRSVLGRRSHQSLVRPRVLTCSRGTPDEGQLEELAGVDLAILDIQGANGTSTFELAKGLLHMRGANKHTLLIASAPCEIAALVGAVPANNDAILAGDLPTPPRLTVHCVDNARTLDDRNLEFALEVQAGSSAAAHFVARHGKHAWWALRQRIGTEGRCREYDNYLRALASLKESDPTSAAQFEHASTLLASAGKSDRNMERRRAIINVALGAPGGGDTAILVRDEAEAATLREALAQELGIALEALLDLGLHIHPYWRRPTAPAKHCVLAGYFGRRTIDAALRAHAQNLHFVADPTERRAAWYTLRDQVAVLRSIQGLSAVADVLVPLMQGIEEHTAAVGALQDLDVTTPPPAIHSFSCDDRSFPRPPPGSVLVAFTDGEIDVVPEGARFEVLARVGGYVQTKPARELERGDETIILNDHSQSRFSEFVLTTLDGGPLKPLVEKREQWLALVRTATSIGKLTTAALTQRLTAAGHDVDRATVRTWTTFPSATDTAVPRTYPLFAALASALEIALPDFLLRDIFSAIRRMRTLHRLTGRQLARAIRLSYLGVLDAPSQERLQRAWGIDPNRLLEAARIATVDHVLTGGR
jgi:hypothetical protein